MFRRLLISFSLFLMLATGADKTPVRANGATCAPRNAEVLAEGGAAVVYQVDDSVYGCLKKTGKRRLISFTEASSPCEGSLDRLRLSGFYVAWGETDQCRGTANFRAYRENLRTGKRASANTGTRRCDEPDGFCGFGIGAVRAIVVNPRGSFAWLACDAAGCEVWRYDGRGRTLIASSSDIDRGFLRRRNDLIEWREGGLPRRASLEP